MQQHEATEWLLSAVRDAVDDPDLSISDTDAAVGITESRDPPRYPYVGVQLIGTTDATAGVGNDALHVDSTTYTNGTLSAVTYRRDVTLQVNITPVTDGDRARRDTIVDVLTTNLRLRERLDTYPDNIEEITVGDPSQASSVSDLIQGTQLPVEVEFERYVTDDDPPVADEVNLDIDVTDDPSDDSSTDAYEETF